MAPSLPRRLLALLGCLGLLPEQTRRRVLAAWPGKGAALYVAREPEWGLLLAARRAHDEQTRRGREVEEDAQ